MKTLAAINTLPYEQAASSIASYRDIVQSGLQAFLSRYGPLSFVTQLRARTVIIAIGSDHGLCGNYNELLAAEVAHALPVHAPMHLICVGAQLEDALHGRGLRPEPALLPAASADGLGRLAGELVTRLDSLAKDTGLSSTDVLLVFTQRSQHGRQHPITNCLLPLDAGFLDRLAHTAWPSNSLPQSNLPATKLLAALIRNWLYASVYSAAAEALVTENSARLERMQQAEQSVDERLQDLAKETRTVRQSDITTELLDVVIGFEALRTRDRLKRC